jgi:hypothetical protein
MTPERERTPGRFDGAAGAPTSASVSRRQADDDRRDRAAPDRGDRTPTAGSICPFLSKCNPRFFSHYTVSQRLFFDHMIDESIAPMILQEFA